MSTITVSDFEYIRRVVRDDAAIVLEPGKEYLAEDRLAPVARRAGLGSLEALVAELRRGSGELRTQVVDALTTNETSFFRDGHPWEALRTVLLPELIERRASERRLTIWCAAASSGQEPYSVALLVRDDLAERLHGWDVRILGTDISPTMLDRARAGRYSQLEVNRGLPAPMLVRWFRRQGLDWELDEEVRSLVELRPANLADDADLAGVPPVDLVLLRNVLIYFDLDTKRRILAAAAARLRPGGVLMVGASETLIDLSDAFERGQLDRTVYYRLKGDR